MLRSLTIRDVVLIKSLSLSFEPGLGVLTGETGAGKSILLDALSLATGRRGDSALVSKSEKQASVSAEFTLDQNHPVFTLMKDQGIDPGGDQIILRRVLSADGRSRAFVNDEPVTVGFLRSLGDALLEIHGQHDDRGLLNPSGHRALLDAFGGHAALLEKLAKVWQAWTEARNKLEALKRDIAASRKEEEYDRHCYEELKALNPEKGEEERLAAARALMMQGEKAADQLADVLQLLEENDGVEMTVRSALRRLERMPEELNDILKPAIEALARAANDLAEGHQSLARASEVLDFDQEKLEKTEERLFEIRALARKHKCQPDDLPGLLDDFAKRLNKLEHGDEALKVLEKDVADLRFAYEKQASLLSGARKDAAAKLDQGVAVELKPLKLEKAKFHTRIIPLSPEDFGPEGAERVEFEVSTNPGAPFGPLVKIASGGELSRFILALKVVLASAGSAPTLIFDEVDRGVGGAVADAVGERLARLSKEAQVLIVTHSPQVAARADHHWQVGKMEKNGATTTTVVELDVAARHEEIARMLSGATVTDKARAAAESLIAGGAS